MRKRYKIFTLITCLFFDSILLAHGWDYNDLDEEKGRSLCKYCYSNDFIFTAITFLILFLISVSIRKFQIKRIKLLSNLIIFSSLMYIVFINKYPVIDVVQMALGLFFFFGLIIILSFLAYIALIIAYKLILKAIKFSINSDKS